MRKQGGFTIIEVSLFLSISAVVAAALLFSMIAMVRQQQWNDSMNTMRTLIQNEYQNVANGINGRVGQNPCNDDSSNTAGHSKGCMYIGRLISFNTTNSTYTVSDVVATNPNACSDSANSSACSTEAGALGKIGLTVSGSNNHGGATKVSWNGNLGGIATFPQGAISSTAPETFSASNNSIAILRSPINGQVNVFVGGSNILTALSGSGKPFAILISSGGGSLGANSGAICVNAGATANVFRGSWPNSGDKQSVRCSF